MNITKVLSRLWLPALLLVVLVSLITLTSYASPYRVILVTSILMFLVLTVSWSIFSGPTGYLSLATAAFFGVGVYTAAVLGTKLPLPVVVLIGGLLSSCLALLVGAVTLRLRGTYFAIFTFGLVELIKHLLLWYEVQVTGTRGRFVIVVDNNTIYHLMLIIFLVLVLTAYLIRRSRWGLALQSIGQNEEAAAHMGVNVTQVKVITFAISAIFIGAAGAVMAPRWTYVDPYMAFRADLYSFMPVLMAVFGGLGHPFGPILGATVFSYVEEILITRFPDHYMLLLGTILVLVVLYLPNGLVGVVQKWRNRRSERLERQQHAIA
jgi:branched-chain amino acid transport system permease protein